MITKDFWKLWNIEINDFRKSDKFVIYRNRWKNELFIKTLFLVILTPILILIEISLLPLEIVYYFFCKWLEKENK